jgi:nickel/cobalt transporter (NiCoT) family protein
MDSMPTDIGTLGLLFVLGLRHGLDPDHIAVIDNLTLRAVERDSPWARWTGSLFAAGHSLSVLGVALIAGWAAADLAWPRWFSPLVDGLIVGLLLLVGTTNLLSLRRPGGYTPVGWRSALVPGWLGERRGTSGALLVGIVFGLVFDTATQAAAWGVAASAQSGLGGAAAIVLAFAVGMIITDTLDSQIVARLMDTDSAELRARYRRLVGFVIVATSYGMAGYALASLVFAVELPDMVYTWLGLGFVCVVGGALLLVRRLSRAGVAAAVSAAPKGTVAPACCGGPANGE